MERPVLKAEIRKEVGKGNARKLRAKGLAPAIFYGPRTETISLVIDPKELAKTLQTEAGENVLLDLDIRKVIEIQCLPGDIPKSIDIDISSLKIGDSIHVQDIKVEKAKILSETNFTIATVVPPAVEEKKVEEVVVEAATEAEA